MKVMITNFWWAISNGWVPRSFASLLRDSGSDVSPCQKVTHDATKPFSANTLVAGRCKDGCACYGMRTAGKTADGRSVVHLGDVHGTNRVGYYNADGKEYEVEGFDVLLVE